MYFRFHLEIRFKRVANICAILWDRTFFPPLFAFGNSISISFIFPLFSIAHFAYTQKDTHGEN